MEYENSTHMLDITTEYNNTTESMDYINISHGYHNETTSTNLEFSTLSNVFTLSSSATSLINDKLSTVSNALTSGSTKGTRLINTNGDSEIEKIIIIIGVMGIIVLCLLVALLCGCYIYFRKRINSNNSDKQPKHVGERLEPMGIESDYNTLDGPYSYKSNISNPGSFQNDESAIYMDVEESKLVAALTAPAEQPNIETEHQKVTNIKAEVYCVDSNTNTEQQSNHYQLEWIATCQPFEQNIAHVQPTMAPQVFPKPTTYMQQLPCDQQISVSPSQPTNAMKELLANKVFKRRKDITEKACAHEDQKISSDFTDKNHNYENVEMGKLSTNIHELSNDNYDMQILPTEQGKSFDGYDNVRFPCNYESDNSSEPQLSIDNNTYDVHIVATTETPLSSDNEYDNVNFKLYNKENDVKGKSTHVQHRDEINELQLNKVFEKRKKLVDESCLTLPRKNRQVESESDDDDDYDDVVPPRPENELVYDTTVVPGDYEYVKPEQFVKNKEEKVESRKNNTVTKPQAPVLKMISPRSVGCVETKDLTERESWRISKSSLYNEIGTYNPKLEK